MELDEGTFEAIQLELELVVVVIPTFIGISASVMALLLRVLLVFS